MTEITICIDGGGSKTLMWLLDEAKERIAVTKEGMDLSEVQAPSSNINSVGEETVRKTLQALFNGVILKATGRKLTEVLPRCRIVAGMAGVAVPQTKEKVERLFMEFGIPQKNIQLMTDAEIALKLLPGDGIALISGTGSIALARRGERTFREGGLGPILGDEGSAHKIGLALIAAIAAEENRKATDAERVVDSDITELKRAIKAAEVPDVFRVDEMRTLISRLKEIPPAEFALLSPVVFEEANKQNRQALRILKEAAAALQTLILGLEQQAGLTQYQLDLHGGVFKGPYANLYINEIKLAIQAAKICNRSYEIPILAYAQTH